MYKFINISEFKYYSMQYMRLRILKINLPLSQNVSEITQERLFGTNKTVSCQHEIKSKWKLKYIL